MNAIGHRDVTTWFEWRVSPHWVGWYEIRAFMCDDGMRMFWNGREWGFWEGKYWEQWKPVATDKWRGLSWDGFFRTVIEGKVP